MPVQAIPHRRIRPAVTGSELLAGGQNAHALHLKPIKIRPTLFAPQSLACLALHINNISNPYVICKPATGFAKLFPLSFFP